MVKMTHHYNLKSNNSKKYMLILKTKANDSGYGFLVQVNGRNAFIQ